MTPEDTVRPVGSDYLDGGADYLEAYSAPLFVTVDPKYSYFQDGAA